jgi:hypothetical protein
VAIAIDADRALVTKLGESVRVFITEVGFVNGSIARQSERFVAVRFPLQPSIERDLLISKLFTLGLDTTDVKASVGSVTVAMLSSIVAARTSIAKTTNNEAGETLALPEQKSAAESLVVRPKAQIKRLVDIGAERRSFAA